MIALHLDPNGPNVTQATAEHWERLTGIMAEADKHGHKLTILMSSDWAELADEESSRKMALKTWVANGHQLGYHHHTCDHASPDGYRDISLGSCTGATDRGSVALAFAKVRDLATSLELSTSVDIAAQGPNTNGVYRAAEWQPEAIYATGEMGDNGDAHGNHRFITLPRCTTEYGNSYGGSQVTYTVAELGHAQLNVGAFTTIQWQNTLAALETEVDLVVSGSHAETGVHIGVVFHGREYYANPRTVSGDNYDDDEAYLNAVFQLFADKGLPVVTAREILTMDAPCSN
jgi:hypothetical protein